MRYIAFAVVFSIVLNVCAVTRVSAAVAFDTVKGDAFESKRQFVLTRNMEKHEEKGTLSGSGKIGVPDYTGTITPSSFKVGNDAVAGKFGIALNAKVSEVLTSFSGTLTYSGLSYSNNSFHSVVKVSKNIALNKSLNPTHTYQIDIAFANAHEIADYCSVTSRQLYFYASGKEFATNDQYGITAIVSGVNGRWLRVSFEFDIIARNVVTGNNTVVCGVSADGYTVTVQDLGTNTSDLGSKIDKGNEIGQEGNEIAQEGNKIGEKANEIAEKQAETSKNIFDKISDFFAGFFNGIINALKSVFVPEDGYFQDFFTRLNDFFSQKLGMLYAPIGFFVDIMTAIGNADSVDVGIPFPGIKWEDTYLIEPQTVNLSSYADEFPELQEKLYFVTDLILIGAVLYLVQNKLREVLHN